MAAQEADAVVMVQDGLPMGVVTEGDLVERVLATSADTSGPVMSLVERPPVALSTSERLFDAMRTMMRERIRRVVVVDAEDGRLRGLLTAEDMSHYRGLDPVATTERLERAQTVEELAGLRADSSRRLYRLYHQGVHSEDLLDLVTEVDDQLKRQVLRTVEAELAAELGDGVYQGEWAWLTFGASGRRESVLRAWQDNGLVYADPAPGDADRAAAYYERLATRARQGAAAVRLRRPRERRRRLVGGVPPAALVVARGLRRLGRGHRRRGRRPGPRCASTCARSTATRSWATRSAAPSPSTCPTSAWPRSWPARAPASTCRSRRSTAWRWRRWTARTGLNLRTRAVQPIVRLARAMAVDAGALESANTFRPAARGRRERPPRSRPRPRR